MPKSWGEFDYVIVGAGSAGCVIANRLSSNPSVSVAILEAGGRDWNPWIHVPVGYFKTMHNPSVDWCYQTEPDKGLNGRRLEWPRGKVLGGSSSLNGLLYVRGQKEDYDGWRQMGNVGWGWDDVLPYFKRAEDQERGEDDFHGVGGPLAVSNMRLSRPICDAWVAAAQNAGYPFNPDYNGASQEGVGYFQLTARKGRRCSTAVGYLHPIKHRKNLQIFTHAQTKRLLIEEGRAAGVVLSHHGSECLVRAKREVILSAGAIGSPQILMYSGIGPGKELAEHGISPVVDQPEVGKNLQDHLQARLVYKCNEPTLNDEVRSLFNQARIGLKYIMFRAGPMTMAASLATGFMRTNDAVATPDIQFHIQPWSADSPGEGVHPFSAFTASVCQLRPESKGEIRIGGPDPLQYPKIYPNYLATGTDQRTIVDGIRIAMRIAEEQPLAGKIASRFRPGPDVASDEDILEWARNTATTIYHPTGTCRMGPDDRAVVDPRLRVRGVRGLRIADCSIMPRIVSGNTNAPAIMIGEKASDMIAEDAAA
ncbi:Alcohol dehydrogenase [acceptor] [Candidatus Filomicrobium marinum]|uniref:Alcohol dehydrogenase [acceptor] n=1 Tax=Candidatus Filomicrobium marinum TaxID=1608628 RepID=A0A0D6JIX9_9HYPH|nr:MULTISPECIES: choline dehydrogenase [Filomicrobium]MCV0370907.1 choline dehydrogenase [Filomicrobium sp.]CFX33139.1 Alcohol dehydrogenase [acceptor] [Candidatus Filomicrobium marinum]CPR21934.1 Alcohol dehydrogenase [acceptor] [Candidatus Filomicrobium marinum]